MVKCWLKRIQLVVAFIPWNIIALIVATWFALQDGLAEYMAKFGITPKEFAQCWKNLDKQKEEHSDAD